VTYPIHTSVGPIPERWTAKQWACVVAAIAQLEGEPALRRSRRATPRSVAVAAGCSDQTARTVLRRLRKIGLLGRYHYNGPWAEHYFPVRATRRVR
jgi:hypothetical protein